MNDSTATADPGRAVWDMATLEAECAARALACPGEDHCLSAQTLPQIPGQTSAHATCDTLPVPVAVMERCWAIIRQDDPTPYSDPDPGTPLCVYILEAIREHRHASDERAHRHRR